MSDLVALVNLGGFAFAAVVLYLIQRAQLTAFQNELRAERDACDRRHQEAMLAIAKVSDAIRDIARIASDPSSKKP